MIPWGELTKKKSCPSVGGSCTPVQILVMSQSIYVIAILTIR